MSDNLPVAPEPDRVVVPPPTDGMSAEEAADVVHRMATLWPNKLEAGAGSEAEVRSRLLAWQEFFLRFDYGPALQAIDWWADRSSFPPSRAEFRQALQAVLYNRDGEVGAGQEQMGIIPGGIREMGRVGGMEHARALRETLAGLGDRLTGHPPPPAPPAREVNPANAAVVWEANTPRMRATVADPDFRAWVRKYQAGELDVAPLMSQTAPPPPAGDTLPPDHPTPKEDPA